MLLPLPAAPYEACQKRSTRVTSLALVRYRANDYSLPVCPHLPAAHVATTAAADYLTLLCEGAC